MRTAAVLLMLMLSGCASSTLTGEDRVKAVDACEAAILAALPGVLAMIDRTDSTNLQKATETDAALRQANALPACAKVGSNALTVLREQRAARRAK